MPYGETWDTEPIAKCEYPVTSYGTPELERDCGEPAANRVIWFDPTKDYEVSGGMNVCDHHLAMWHKYDGVSYESK